MEVMTTSASKDLPPDLRRRGPGLVDLQVNGFAGVDFNCPPDDLHADALHHAVEAMERHGIVAALPTIITDDPYAMLGRVQRFAALILSDDRLLQSLPGLHVEGPFIQPEDGPRGAHPREWCTTPERLPKLMQRLIDAAEGLIRMVTMAPELPGAAELIRSLTAAGVVVAIGHTSAGPGDLDAAIRAGARIATHLGNGSHNMLSRLDNYIQHQLADDRLLTTFIADGHHIPWPTLKNFLRAKQPERAILVSDAISAADAGPGRYVLGGVTVEVSADGRCRQPGTNWLAGSALTLDRAVVNVHRYCGLTLEQAWQMASLQPAGLIGIPDPPTIDVLVTDRFEDVQVI